MHDRAVGRRFYSRSARSRDVEAGVEYAPFSERALSPSEVARYASHRRPAEAARASGDLDRSAADASASLRRYANLGVGDELAAGQEYLLAEDELVALHSVRELHRVGGRAVLVGELAERVVLRDLDEYAVLVRHAELHAELEPVYAAAQHLLVASDERVDVEVELAGDSPERVAFFNDVLVNLEQLALLREGEFFLLEVAHEQQRRDYVVVAVRHVEHLGGVGLLALPQPVGLAQVFFGYIEFFRYGFQRFARFEDDFSPVYVLVERGLVFFRYPSVVFREDAVELQLLVGERRYARQRPYRERDELGALVRGFASARSGGVEEVGDVDSEEALVVLGVLRRDLPAKPYPVHTGTLGRDGRADDRASDGEHQEDDEIYLFPQSGFIHIGLILHQSTSYELCRVSERRKF